MTFETLTSDYLGCREIDLPHSRSLVHELGGVGISVEQLNSHSFLRLAGIVVDEAETRHIIPSDSTGKIYHRIIHDVVAELCTPAV